MPKSQPSYLHSLIPAHPTLALPLPPYPEAFRSHKGHLAHDPLQKTPCLSSCPAPNLMLHSLLPSLSPEDACSAPASLTLMTILMLEQSRPSQRNLGPTPTSITKTSLCSHTCTISYYLHIATLFC